MMLDDSQSIIELEAGLVNFIDIFPRNALINEKSSENILLSIEKSRRVLNLLFKGGPRRVEAGPE